MNLQELSEQLNISTINVQAILNILQQNYIKFVRVLQISKEYLIIEAHKITTKQLISILIVKYQDQQCRDSLKSKFKILKFKQILDKKNVCLESVNNCILLFQMPLFCQTLSDKIRKNQFKNYERQQLIILFQSFLHLIGTAHQQQSYQNIQPESIIVDKNGRYNLNYFNLLDFDEEKVFSQSNWIGDNSKYIAPEYYTNKDQLLNSKQDIYALGLMFLEIMGLQINEDIQSDLRDEKYQQIKQLENQDLVNFIIKYMICKDHIQRKPLLDLYWLWRFQFNNNQKLNLFEMCEFVQSQIKFDAKQITQVIHKEGGILRRNKLKQDFKQLLCQLQTLNQNGCIIKSISTSSYDILFAGVEGSLFENYLVYGQVKISNFYPLKCLNFYLEQNEIHPQLSANCKLKLVQGEIWKQSYSVFNYILSVIPVINQDKDDQSCCEDNLFNDKDIIQQCIDSKKNKQSIYELYDIYYSQYMEQFKEQENKEII